MAIKAADIYPEFVGKQARGAARTLLAANKPASQPTARPARSQQRPRAARSSSGGGFGSIPDKWEPAVKLYSGSNYGVSHLNDLLKNAPASGQVSGDRKIVREAANRYNIPESLLWATYGAESSWGKAKSWFGLTGAHPGSGTSGNFRSDAFESAQTWARLYRDTHNGKNPDGSTGDPVGSGGGGEAGGGAVTSGIDAEGMQTIGTAAAFSVVLEGPTSADRLEADIGGARSYMNDKPLIEFVDQICSASMRHYQSMPDGRFYAFFPDYFGSFNHRAPYWEISDIEITDFNIYLSDDELYTHVYVVGDTMPVGSPQNEALVGPEFLNKLRSNGVVTIFDAFNLNWLGNVSNENDKAFVDTTAFLKKYGVRPYYEEAHQIHSSFYELFVAYQRFMFLWARQFLTQCEFTFMPELYPGGRVSLKNHGVICYVDSVKHEFDYESGFTTTAQLSAPSADVNSKVPFSMGMVRPETGGAK